MRAVRAERFSGRKDGWFFADALMVMLLAVIYFLLTGSHSRLGEPESVGTTAALQTHKQ